MKNLRQTGTRKPAPPVSTAANPAPAETAPSAAPVTPDTTPKAPDVVTPSAPAPAQPAAPAPQIPNRIMQPGMVHVRAVAGHVSAPEGVKLRGEKFYLPHDRFRAMGADVAEVRE